MQQQEKKKGRHHKRQRKRLWIGAEYVLCFLALVIALSMTGTALSRIGYIAGESGQEAAREEKKEPEYVTFARGIVGFFGKGGDESAPEEKPKEPEKVDIDQFKDDDGYAGQIYDLREEYPEQVEKILSHYEGAVVRGEGEETTLGEQERNAIPERLLQMVISNVETIDFVADYPEQYDQRQEYSLEKEAKSETVPLLLQWDERWGYEEYGDGLIGYTGCGPTCLAMVALYLSDDPEITPKAVAEFADRAGYYTDGVGSTWTLMGEGCTHYGLVGTEMPISESGMAQRLEEGSPLICALGPGDFTQSGHFIVITGYEDGEFTVNDPNSPVRSGQTWSYESLSGQIRNIWYFTMG